jgi:RHS repeat-associated protein
VLELDDSAAIVSYEEYFPFGATSYQAVASQTDVPKRYRFTGKERDTENDLYYHGARYYAPWLGRWTSCDPVGSADGQTLYGYAADNPVRYTDPTGRDPDDDNEPPPVGMSAKPGNPTLFPPIVARPGIDAPNYWYSTMSQGSGVMPDDSTDVESGVLVVVSRTTGLTLRLPVTGGGLSSAVLAFRQQVLAKGLDVGITGAGSYTGQESSSVTTGAGTAPGTSQGSGSVLGTVHYGRQGLGGTNLVAAGYLSGGYQHGEQTGQPGTDAGLVQLVPAFGLEWDPPKDPLTLSGEPSNPYAFYLSSLLLNPVISYASRGSLSQGPTMNNLWTAGGIASAGVAWGKTFGLVGEVSVTRAWGSPLAGSDQAASSWAERAGLVLTYNYLDRTGSGLQTSSVAFGVWYGHEAGTVTGTPGPGAPVGNWDGNSIYFGAIFGYRRSPQQQH